jgi:hypothetical protein
MSTLRYVRILFGILLTVAACVFVLVLLVGVMSGDQDVIDATPGFVVFIAITLIPGTYLLARNLSWPHRTSSPPAIEAPAGKGWLERRRAVRKTMKETQESRKEQARVDGRRKFETRHAALIGALREVGHSPTVNSSWVDSGATTDGPGGGGWSFVLLCGRCRHRHWPLVPKRFRRLSPDRPCVPR